MLAVIPTRPLPLSSASVSSVPTCAGTGLKHSNIAELFTNAGRWVE